RPAAMCPRRDAVADRARRAVTHPHILASPQRAVHVSAPFSITAPGTFSTHRQGRRPVSDPLTPANSTTTSGKGREMWNSRFGFLMAAVGSAVGLGNMWRFAYMASEHGGAAAVLFYVLLTFMVGVPVMIAEFVLGRSARLSPIGALRKELGRSWAP